MTPSTPPDTSKGVTEAAQAVLDRHDEAKLKELAAGGTYFSIPAKELSALDAAIRDLRAALAALSPLPAPEPTEGIAEQPISRMSADDGRPMWEQISDLIKFHMNERPPIRLRDELVTILAWARYGEQAATALTALQAELSAARRQRDDLGKAWDSCDSERKELRARLESCERHCVPISTDGRSVFIDGHGDVPLDFDRLTERAEAELAAMKEGATVARDGLMAARSIVVALIGQEYNIETWGLHSRLKAIDLALAVFAASPEGDRR